MVQAAVGAESSVYTPKPLSIGLITGRSSQTPGFSPCFGGPSNDETNAQWLQPGVSGGAFGAAAA